MTSLFESEYRKVTGTEEASVVLWLCPNEGCDAAGLYGYWQTPICSLCTEPMERSES